jgi:hypothetical protein
VKSLFQVWKPKDLSITILEVAPTPVESHPKQSVKQAGSKLLEVVEGIDYTDSGRVATKVSTDQNYLNIFATNSFSSGVCTFEVTYKAGNWIRLGVSDSSLARNSSNCWVGKGAPGISYGHDGCLLHTGTFSVRKGDSIGDEDQHCSSRRLYLQYNFANYLA